MADSEAVAPFAFFTVKVTVYFPSLLYVCVIFLDFECLLSPKFQYHEVGDPVLLSVNVTLRGAFPEVGDRKKQHPALGDLALH